MVTNLLTGRSEVQRDAGVFNGPVEIPPVENGVCYVEGGRWCFKSNGDASGSFW
jgi:hypothetical protein